MIVRDIIVHWTEIALKGKNRPMFIERLAVNVRNALRGEPLGEVRKLPGRLWLRAKDDAVFGPETFERLKHVYGISSFSPAVRCDLDLEQIKRVAWEIAEPLRYESFRISARRAFKDLPYPSYDVNIAVGNYVYEKRPTKVQMKGADLDLRVEIVPQGAYLYAEKMRGLGGLPVGVTGRVCCLLSGGIDSPVAAFRVMRRGCRVFFVHFHGHPYVTKASLEKAHDMATLLMRHQYEGSLFAVAFGELQAHIVDSAPSRLRVVLYRRFMMRIAELIAVRNRCRALVTGEALAQVASQTLSNMVVIDQATTMPVLRPLVGYDKQEIEAEAKALGSYDISILPDQDCCTLFTPHNPETHAKLVDVLAAEAAFDVDAMVLAAADAAERIELKAPWWQAPRQRDRKRRNAPPAEHGADGAAAPGLADPINR